MINALLVTVNTNKDKHADEDDDHNAQFPCFFANQNKSVEDEDGALTHESQFAGCGKQRKQQSEKTQRDWSQSSGLCTAAFKVPCSKPTSPQLLDLQQNKSTSNSRVTSEEVSDVSLRGGHCFYVNEHV